jgi:hypothetical protein
MKIGITEIKCGVIAWMRLAEDKESDGDPVMKHDDQPSTYTKKRTLLTKQLVNIFQVQKTEM